MNMLEEDNDGSVRQFSFDLVCSMLYDYARINQPPLYYDRHSYFQTQMAHAYDARELLDNFIEARKGPCHGLQDIKTEMKLAYGLDEVMAAVNRAYGATQSMAAFFDVKQNHTYWSITGNHYRVSETTWNGNVDLKLCASIGPANMWTDLLWSFKFPIVKLYRHIEIDDRGRPLDENKDQLLETVDLWEPDSCHRLLRHHPMWQFQTRVFDDSIRIGSFLLSLSPTGIDSVRLMTGSLRMLGSIVVWNELDSKSSSLDDFQRGNQ